MKVSPAARCPVELWIKIAISLRDDIACDHGRRMAENEDNCRIHPCHFNVSNRPRALSETSHFLHDNVGFVLYQVISLDTRYPLQTAAALRTLTKRDHLPRSVLRLSIFCPEVGMDLPLFPCLRSLSLSCCIITPAIVKILSNAVDLDTLNIWSSWWQKDVPRDWSAGGGFGRHIRSLDIATYRKDSEDEGDQERWSQLLAPELVRVRCPISALRAVVPVLEPGRPSLQNIVKLSLRMSYGVGDENVLSKFLEYCPNVEELDVLDSPGPSTYHFPHPRDRILGRLHYISASSTLISALPLLSSLKTAVVNCSMTTVDMEHFRISAPSLQSLWILRVTWKEDVLETIGARCPWITHLDIQFNSSTANTNKLTGIERLPRLQELRLTISPPGAVHEESQLSARIEEDREILNNIKGNHCQDLREACFEEGYRHWIYTTESGWMIFKDLRSGVARAPPGPPMLSI